MISISCGVVTFPVQYYGFHQIIIWPVVQGNLLCPIVKKLEYWFFFIMAKYKHKLLAIHIPLNFLTQLLIKSITHVYNQKFDNSYVIQQTIMQHYQLCCKSYFSVGNQESIHNFYTHINIVVLLHLCMCFITQQYKLSKLITCLFLPLV